MKVIRRITVRDSICRRFRRRIPCVDWYTQRARWDALTSELRLQSHDSLWRQVRSLCADNRKQQKCTRSVITYKRQEGWLLPKERASVHILASPGYTPGTIAVNVTWMERRFNARQTHSSTYPSIFNRLRAIARYWLEIATTPLHLTPPLEFRENVWSWKLESWGYRAVKTVWR